MLKAYSQVADAHCQQRCMAAVLPPKRVPTLISQHRNAMLPSPSRRGGNSRPARGPQKLQSSLCCREIDQMSARQAPWRPPHAWNYLQMSKLKPCARATRCVAPGQSGADSVCMRRSSIPERPRSVASPTRPGAASATAASHSGGAHVPTRGAAGCRTDCQTHRTTWPVEKATGNSLPDVYRSWWS